MCLTLVISRVQVGQSTDGSNFTAWVARYGQAAIGHYWHMPDRAPCWLLVPHISISRSPSAGFGNILFGQESCITPTEYSGPSVCCTLFATIPVVPLGSSCQGECSVNAVPAPLRNASLARVLSPRMQVGFDSPSEITSP